MDAVLEVDDVIEDDVFGESCEPDADEEAYFVFDADWFEEMEEIGDCTTPRQYRAALRRYAKLETYLDQMDDDVSYDTFCRCHRDMQEVHLFIDEYEEANEDTYMGEYYKVFKRETK